MSQTKRFQIFRQLFCLNSLLITLPLSLGGCTHPVTPTKTALSFDPRGATHLLIAKSDPSSGDHWTARLEKQDSTWLILGGDKGELIDHEANSSLITHILDSLHELHLLREAPPSTLSNMGLEPPTFDLKFDERSEIKVGQPLETGSFYLVEGGAPLIAAGTAYPLLAQLSSFEALRQKNLFTGALDDVDEVVFKKGKSKPLTAKRNPSLDEGFAPPLIQALHGVTEAQIARFVDTPSENQRLLTQLHAHPLVRVILRDRKKVENEIAFIRVKDHAYAVTSRRGNAVFEVDPAVLNEVVSAQ